jgi:hypothetical protein
MCYILKGRNEGLGKKKKKSRILTCCSLVQREPTVNFQQNLHETTYYSKLDV